MIGIGLNMKIEIRIEKKGNGCTVQCPEALGGCGHCQKEMFLPAQWVCDKCGKRLSIFTYRKCTGMRP